MSWICLKELNEVKEKGADRYDCPVMDVAFLQGRCPAPLLRTSFTPIGIGAAILLKRVPLSHNVTAAAPALQYRLQSDFYPSQE